MFEMPDWFAKSQGKFMPIDPMSPFQGPMGMPGIAPPPNLYGALSPAPAAPSMPSAGNWNLGGGQEGAGVAYGNPGPQSMASYTSPSAPEAPKDALGAYRAATAPAGGLGGSPSVPMPPRRPGGNWDTTTALEGENEPVTPERQIGTGHWMKNLEGMVDKNSLMGKLFAMKNPSAAPGSPAPPQGLLPQLYSMFSSPGAAPGIGPGLGGLW